MRTFFNYEVSGTPLTPAPGSLAEANQNLIESYVRSGMREDTARKSY